MVSKYRFNNACRQDSPWFFTNIGIYALKLEIVENIDLLLEYCIGEMLNIADVS